MAENNLDHAGLEILTVDECRQLLAEAGVGRLAFVERGEPTILPVNIGMWEHKVVFSTAEGSKLDAALMRQPVAIEVDGIDAVTHSGWSVLAKGVADLVDDGREIDALDRLSVQAWVRPGVPKRWVAVRIDELTGRRIPAGGV